MTTELSPLARAALSTRQAEVHQRRFEEGIRSPNLFTADAEKISLSRPVLLERWQRQLEAVGLSVADVLELDSSKPTPQRRLDERRFAAMVLGDDRRVTRRKVVEAWAWASGGQSVQKVSAAVDLLVEKSSSVFEGELREVEVIPASRVLQTLGNRPLEAKDLVRWLEASRRLERSLPSGYRDHDAECTRVLRSASHGWSR